MARQKCCCDFLYRLEDFITSWSVEDKASKKERKHSNLNNLYHCTDLILRRRIDNSISSCCTSNQCRGENLHIFHAVRKKDDLHDYIVNLSMDSVECFSRKDERKKETSCSSIQSPVAYTCITSWLLVW